MKALRIGDIVYRNTVEAGLTLGITLGQTHLQAFAEMMVSQYMNYLILATSAYYLADFAVRSMLQPYFFNSHYKHNRGAAMLSRGVRNLVQAAANVGGAHLFYYALLSAKPELVIGAGVGIGLFKLLTDALYDIAETFIDKGYAKEYASDYIVI